MSTICALHEWKHDHHKPHLSSMNLIHITYLRFSQSSSCCCFLLEGVYYMQLKLLQGVYYIASNATDNGTHYHIPLRYPIHTLLPPKCQTYLWYTHAREQDNLLPHPAMLICGYQCLYYMQIMCTKDHTEHYIVHKSPNGHKWAPYVHCMNENMIITRHNWAAWTSHITYRFLSRSLSCSPLSLIGGAGSVRAGLVFAVFHWGKRRRFLPVKSPVIRHPDITQLATYTTCNTIRL